MMNGLNKLDSYTEYFNLTRATISLATAALWIGGDIAGLTYGKVTDIIGRRYAFFLGCYNHYSLSGATDGFSEHCHAYH